MKIFSGLVLVALLTLGAGARRRPGGYEWAYPTVVADRSLRRGAANRCRQAYFKMKKAYVAAAPRSGILRLLPGSRAGRGPYIAAEHLFSGARATEVPAPADKLRASARLLSHLRGVPRHRIPRSRRG